jgi:hypothetical protein
LSRTDTCDFAIYRLNADGSLDMTFGVNGVHCAPVGVAPAPGLAAKRLHVMSDGRIVTLGTHFGRLWPDGSPDTSISSNGYKPISAGVFSVGNMALLPDGRSVIARSSQNSRGIVCFDQWGDQDMGFGVDGIALPAQVCTSTPFYTGCNYPGGNASRVTSSTDGRIAVATVSGSSIAVSMFTSALVTTVSDLSRTLRWLAPTPYTSGPLFYTPEAAMPGGSIAVMNVYGQLVNEFNVSELSGGGAIDISTETHFLNNGMYLLHHRSNAGANVIGRILIAR